MIETKIRKVGNSAVMTLTTEMLTILDAKEGDTLFVVRGDDGSLKITPHDPAVASALAAAEIVKILFGLWRRRRARIGDAWVRGRRVLRLGRCRPR